MSPGVRRGGGAGCARGFFRSERSYSQPMPRDRCRGPRIGDAEWRAYAKGMASRRKRFEPESPTMRGDCQVGRRRALAVRAPRLSSGNSHRHSKAGPARRCVTCWASPRAPHRHVSRVFCKKMSALTGPKKALVSRTASAPGGVIANDCRREVSTGR